jgi:hypothetical protein
VVLRVAAELQMMCGQAEGGADGRRRYGEGAGGLVRFLGQCCSWEEVNREGAAATEMCVF